MSNRIVVGPAVVLPDGAGKQHYFYQGSALPDGLVEERVQAAITDGLVSEEKSAEELTVDDLDTAAAGDRLRAAGRPTDSVVAPSGDEDRPPKTANKQAWIDHVVDLGADPEWANDPATTKDDLQAWTPSADTGA